MARTFFSALGIVAAALLLFSASFLGNVAADLDSRRDEYAAVAVDATRELSRTWKLSAIEHHYAAEALEELSPVLGADLDGLKLLGPMLHAEDIRIEPRWSHALSRQAASPGGVADRLAALINRTARVTFIAKFAGGTAEVSVELKREGGRIKLWQLRIDARQRVPQPEEQERRLISHA